MAESLELRAIGMQREVGGASARCSALLTLHVHDWAPAALAEGAETEQGVRGGTAALPLPGRRRPRRFSSTTTQTP